MNKAVFLDRDGVINHTIFRMGKPRAPYTLNEFQLFDGVIEAIALLKLHQFLLIVVTNQPDVARGWVSRESVERMNYEVQELLGVNCIKVCFHTEHDFCNCRKPQPGMLLEAASELSIDMKESYMVGDRITDIDAGISAGCRTVLIDESENFEHPRPHFQTNSLLKAAEWIVKQF